MGAICRNFAKYDSIFGKDLSIEDINPHSVEFEGHPVIIRDGVCLDRAETLLDFDASVVLES